MTEKNKKQKLGLSDEERLEMNEIFQNSEEIKGNRMLFDDLTKNFKSEDEVKRLIFGNEIIDNPQGKHEIYYRGIEKMLRMITRSGKREKDASFEILREEKNIFLARGKQKDYKGVRNFDVRQAFESDMDAAYALIMKSITGGMSAYELYISFRNDNIDKGYYNYLLETNTPNISNNPRLLDIFRELKRRQRDSELKDLLV